jgi:hypothetical protein
MQNLSKDTPTQVTLKNMTENPLETNTPSNKLELPFHGDPQNNSQSSAEVIYIAFAEDGQEVV